MMVELGTPATLMDDQMGHEDGSVQARYAHITSGMTQRLLDGLTDLWTVALDARRSLSPASPVAVLDRLLAGVGSERRKIVSPDSPQRAQQQKSGSVPEGRNPL